MGIDVGVGILELELENQLGEVRRGEAALAQLNFTCRPKIRAIKSNENNFMSSYPFLALFEFLN